MAKIKNSVKKEWHAPKSPIGSGDFYGTGIKQPIGKPIRSYVNDGVKLKRLSKPPKSLA